MDNLIPIADLYGALVIVVCLVFSAFFSSSETAITSMGVLKTKQLIENGGVAVKQLQFWLDHPNRVLTTILIYNNVVNILASAVATDMATRHFNSNVIGISTGAITFLVLVFGEIIPKAFARAHYETLSVIALKILYVFYVLSYPFVWMFSEFASFILRMMGSKDNLRPSITEEELEFMINESKDSGALHGLKKNMISGVIDFDETKVSEIMTPRTNMECLEKNESIDEAVKLVIQSGHSRIPIYEEKLDNIVGVLFAKDCLRMLNTSNTNGELKIMSLMREPYFVPESKFIMDVFKDLKRNKNHMAVVIDEYGGTAGIVTMEDILEEIVGEIQDEFDVEEADILEIESGIYDVAGLTNIDDFLEYFGVEELEDEHAEDVDTVAGWMIYKLGEMPQVGQSMIVGPLSIEVSEVGRHRIERLRVTRLSRTMSSTDQQQS